MRRKEFKERIEFLKEKASYVGATFEHSFWDHKHLDRFWYDGVSIATIQYKGYTVYFDVAGSFSAVLYKRGKFKDVLRHEDGTASFYGVTDCMKTIKNDKAVCNPKKIDFDNTNYITVVVSDKAGNTVSNLEKLEESNFLEAIENHFNHYIEYIDSLEEKKK